jgi:NAD(P)-dependent dehydrogenase (short-subunit alcohol dehydrogenase family)
MVLQISWSGVLNPGKTLRMPTFPEERFMTYQAIINGARGIRVSCLCPQGVRTPMLEAATSSFGAAHLTEHAIDASEVAEAVVRGIAAETFLILPHPVVHEYMQRKAADPDRWLRGMRRLRESVFGRR